MEVKDLKREDVIYLLKHIWHYPNSMTLKNFGEDKFFDGKRKIDIVFSRGYDDPEYTTILFCITGSPNKLFGWIAQSRSSCPFCYKRHITEINCNKGTFYLSLDLFYDKKELGRLSRKRPPCFSDKNFWSKEQYLRWKEIQVNRKNRVMGLNLPFEA